ncbi:auxin-responsive protein IAA13-like [Malania oleifera]|uniref:auxin-responsive protein IAA13-like n=1 Tax=Malania oleifera TaxID=397392 RepID=UPI0025ADEC1A|nr:auxin-responsive protein IAA13-like [Malania oleifera]
MARMWIALAIKELISAVCDTGMHRSGLYGVDPFRATILEAYVSSVAAVSGTKRAVDFVAQEVATTAGISSQVVGWLPIRAYKMNSLANQAKTLTSKEDETCEDDKLKDTSKKKVYNGSNKNNTAAMEKGHFGFKVNMDGLSIGRKVDLNAHACYETVAQALEDMFVNPTMGITSIRSSGESEQARKASKILNGSFEFMLTYEDKEGDWMLVGDVPWEMFLNIVKRLRIMKTSEANGLAPRFQETDGRQRREALKDGGTGIKVVPTYIDPGCQKAIWNALSKAELMHHSVSEMPLDTMKTYE